ncbi:hypothetical protein H5395_16240 [Paracoccus sp. MC1854]|uniref:hypothetical protein n=1 Tax=Paracoccus sp. MC1854 TaxID=2760306 RepID=UPI001600E9B0|nr:hypothetical protein [Paracoccus sp. MC1854]MBB1493026.1 hypothetical protein [Paracoccus sp. MC1854]
MPCSGSERHVRCTGASRAPFQLGDLTPDERSGIDLIRVISFGSYPAVTVKSATALRGALDRTQA